MSPIIPDSTTIYDPIRAVPPSDYHPPQRTTLRGWHVALGQTLLIAAVLCWYLPAWPRVLGVPVMFFSDSLHALMQSKSTIDNGWWWFNPRLGAPFGLDLLAFPANSNVDQAIVWVVSRFVPGPLMAVNLAWAAMVVLSGLSATWCMRRMGVSVVGAFVAGTLFAVSPYAMLRNIGHFWLVIYLVPFACATASVLASGSSVSRQESNRSLTWLIAACALLGFNYVYYAFFACFLVLVASVTGFVRERRWPVLATGGLCIAIVAACTLVNTAPSLYSWSRHGRPMVINDKLPAESEAYGLKIRQLISPVTQHWFGPLRVWGEKEIEARFPLETENTRSRLGVVGTVGFFVLLAALFAPEAFARRGSTTMVLSISRLNLAAVLLGTVGGFGSVFSLLVSPEIRAYNRVTPFIAFFSLAAVALTLDTLCIARARRLIAAAIILVIGLADQRMAAVQMNADYNQNALEIPQLEAFVRQLEDTLPTGAMILQLPFRPFPADVGIERMQPFDHLKLYLVSRTARWSYPALSNEQVRWQQAAAVLDARTLPLRMAAEGFAAIVIDRFGYQDNGELIEAHIRAQLPAPHILASTDRYTAIDIRSAAAKTTNIPPLSRKGAMTIGMTSCDGHPRVSVDLIGENAAPVGSQPVRIRGGEDLKITGWAVDDIKATTGAGLDIVIDRVPFPSVYGMDRPDVANHFQQPAYRPSGFEAAIPAASVGPGTHQVAVRLVGADQGCYYESPNLIIVIK